MREGIRRMMGAAAMVLLAAGPAAAQSWPLELGVDAGGAWRTASIKPSSGDNVHFGAGWIADAQLAARLLQPLRLRVNGAFAPAAAKLGSTTQWDKFELSALTGDLMFSLKQAADQWTKTEVLPYVAVGAGARWVRPTGTAIGILFHDTVVPGVVVGPASEQYLLERAVVPVGLAAIGTDIRFRKPLSFRLEAGDRFFKPKADRLASGRTITSRDNPASLTHELYGTAGLHLLLGGGAPAPVAVVAPPPPPVQQTPTVAPPPPPPPPPPAPAEQPVTVCVVDPAAGMQDVSATFLPASGDTMVSGKRITEAYTDRPTLTGQGWYQRGEPLAIGSARYMTFGTARTFRPTEATYLGTVNGLPVFADPNDATALTAALARLPEASRARLDEAARRPAVLRQVRTLKTLYVPTRAAGCVLQPMQLQEMVRKVRG